MLCFFESPLIFPLLFSQFHAHEKCIMDVVCFNKLLKCLIVTFLVNVELWRLFNILASMSNFSTDYAKYKKLCSILKVDFFQVPLAVISHCD